MSYNGYSGNHYGTFYGNSSNGQSFSPKQTTCTPPSQSNTQSSFPSWKRDDSGRPLGNR